MADNDNINNIYFKMLKNTFESIDLNKGRLRCIGYIFNLVTQALLFGESVSNF